jgi:BirA family biotin operon repressor/biotin-[acetyl-CoA-carboxylase] ligase
MGMRWIKHDSLASTNTWLSELLKLKDLQEGTVVIADYQDAGRGLGDHSWVSESGENLLMSMLLFPAFLSAMRQFHLSRVVSLAICDALETLGIEAQVKWPNDILSSKGKIAGILIEHSITAGNIAHTIAGIGLNLNQTEFPVFPVPATSLRLESGKGADVTAVGELVHNHIWSRYGDLKAGRTEALEREYLDRLYKAGIPTVFYSAEGAFEGTIQGVNDYGELLVRQGKEIGAFGHGALRMELEFDRP